MRKFLLKTSFLVMICLSFFIFSYFFTINKGSKLEILRNEANTSKNFIDANLKRDIENIELVRKLAETYLENVPENSKIPEKFHFDLIEETGKNVSYYNMDEAIVQKLHKEIGNITGKGDFKTNPKVIHELKMALSINPVFKQIWERSKHTAWLYYISEEQFINIYPWKSSEEYSFSDHLYNREFYQNTISARNVNRESRWSEPYIDGANLGAVLTLSTPVYKDNEFKGVFGIDLTIKAISAMLLENIKPNMISILVDDKQHLIGTTEFREEYQETIFRVEDILPKGIELSNLKELKDFNKVEAVKKYYVVKRNIEGLPWNLYILQEKTQIYRSVFLEVAPMLIITFALLIIYYELYSRKKSEKELEQVVKRLKRTTTKLEEASKTDPLTGLLNRRGIVDEIKKEYARGNRKKKEFSVIICDIDYFKRVNDTYGHDCGDYVLKNTAKIMKENVKELDFVGRWGGEEFVLLLVETSFKDAMKVAERLRKVLEASIIDYDEHSFNITMSFGVTEYNQHEDLDENIAHADMALYQGKNTGRNRVVGSKRDGKYITV